MSRRKIDPDAKISLPITPMLDMTFQLLFFFIMNFNPADLEGQLEMALPAANEPCHVRPKAGEALDVPNNGAVEFPIDLTVEVRARPVGEGGISALSVKAIDGRSEPIDNLDALEKYLIDKHATSNNHDAIKIRSDSRLCIKHLMKVMDVCKTAGFTKTTLIPPEDSGR
jgi:biopolymer transport protein ExbD